LALGEMCGKALVRRRTDSARAVREHGASIDKHEDLP
jgi:hypothetical protein